MVARVTVTLPEPILERLDSIARTEGVTRSDVMREAASSYLTQRDIESASSARQRSVEEGVAWLDQVAARVPTGTPSSLTLLREVRGTSDGLGLPLDGLVPPVDDAR